MFCKRAEFERPSVLHAPLPQTSTGSFSDPVFLVG